jgi:hypothetical protein
MIYYAGIGSRDTPAEILILMENVAKYLATQHCILRSGGANGADTAFYNGCKNIKNASEIYLPWKNFNNIESKYSEPSEAAMKLAMKYHPAWEKLSQGAKKLQARNCYQLLGNDLKTPSKFVLCYTKEGKVIGGTGQALRMAIDYNIPIFNMGEERDINIVKSKLWSFLKEQFPQQTKKVVKTIESERS